MSAKFLPFHFLPCREKNTDIYLFDPSLILATQILINLCSSFQLVEIFNLLPSFLDVSYLIYFNVSFSYYIIYRSNIETNQCDKPLCHYAFFFFLSFYTSPFFAISISISPCNKSSFLWQPNAIGKKCHAVAKCDQK